MKKKVESRGPSQPEKINYANDKLAAPDHPVVLFIIGDGSGPDIWNACRPVFDAAVEHAYSGARQVHWKELLAGENAFNKVGNWLPKETLDAIREFHVAIKGPLTTPVGGGIRSINVTLRQALELYACVRPVKYIKGVPSPVKQPQKVDMVIFRENMEDVYAGIEWEQGSKEAEQLAAYLKESLGANLPPGSGIGIKAISEANTKRLVRRAIQYALDYKKRSVTLVHKGNIMKYTEGAFRKWGYELAAQEFGEATITEKECDENFRGKVPAGKILLKDRIADSMFQQILLRPEEYDVIAAPNLNGDYLSDALAAQVGGLGMAPGANIGDFAAVFEATHGTAPKYAGKDVVNPCSLMLSGAMMFEFMGWSEAAELIRKGIEKTIGQKTVTYDLARQMKAGRKVRCSQFGKLVCQNLKRFKA